MTKKYVLPSGAELVMDYSAVSPVKNVFTISIGFTLNGVFFGTMKACYGTKASLRNSPYCFEIEEALKCTDKLCVRENERVTIITDLKIEQFFVFEKKTCYIFHNLFRFLRDIGCSSLFELYANMELTEMSNEETESIHWQLMLGLDSYVVF